MPDVPVFFIANFKIHDKEEYRKYEKGFFPILKKHNGSFHTFDDNAVTFEGAPRPGRMVIFQFPSEQAAIDWYNDPEYQGISEFRRAGTSIEFLTMVHGQSPRS